MARIKFGALVNSIAGSVGGATFQRNPFGSVVRSKPNPIHKQSITQLQRRAYLHAIQYAWQALIDEQRLKWKQFVAYSGQTIVHDSNVKISGYNLFVKYQFCRYLYNLPLLVDFTYVPIPNWPTGFNIISDGVQMFIQFNLSILPDDYFFIFSISNPRPNSQSFSFVNCRFVFCDRSNLNTFVFTQSYLNTFGKLANAGDTVHCSIYYFSLVAPLISGFSTYKIVIDTNADSEWIYNSISPTTGVLNIKYGNGLFLAITSNTTGNNLLRSSNGTSWTKYNSGFTEQMYNLCFTGSFWIITTRPGTHYFAYTSSDGITWHPLYNAADLFFNTITVFTSGAYAISYNNSIFTTVRFTSLLTFTITTYSLDGLFLTGIYKATNIYFFGQLHGIALRCTIDNSYIPTIVSTPSLPIFRSIAYGNNIYIAATDSTTGNNFYKSNDCINWVQMNNAPFGPITEITFQNTHFYAVGAGSPNNGCLSSVDGTNWIFSALPSSLAYSTICSNGTLLVCSGPSLSEIDYL